MRFNSLIALAFTLALLPSAALAQSISTSTMAALTAAQQQGPAFTISVDPRYPQPRSQATISLLSSTLDLSNAIVDASVSGKDVYQGSVQPFTVQLGATGTVTNVKVIITSAGNKYTQTVSIQPQDVALIAEPISSAPILYPGKPLVPIEGSVRVVAVANMQDAKGKILDPGTLSYLWTVDGTQIADSSGIGKEAVLVASPLEYRSRTVSVAVMSQDGSLVGGADLSLSAEEPSVHIYENDPLLGILFDHALSDQYSISDSEDTLYAAPFSFPTNNGAPLLQWFLNGDVAQTGNSITLKPTGNGSGNASLSITATGNDSTMATADLSLLFNIRSNTGFLGL